MRKKIFNFIEKEQLLCMGDTIVVAFSGGADSMMLLHFLHVNKQKLGIKVVAAHLNHGLRGIEADRDENFVKKICEQYKIPFFVEKAKMSEKIKPMGQSIEVFARELRYAFLQKIAYQNNAKIATAHTLSDNAETLLFRTIRGTGPKGLSGILPKRDNIIRPLLEITRKEVEEYCAVNRLEYVTDSTNLTTAYTRNKLRLQALPLLEEIHEGATLSLGRLASDMREVNILLQQLANDLLEKAEENNKYNAQILLNAPNPIRLQALASLTDATISRTNLNLLEKVLKKEINATQLPGGKIASLQNGFLQIECKKKRIDAMNYKFTIEEGEYNFGGRFSFIVSICKKTEKSNFYPNADKNSLTFWADYDKIEKVAVFRTRKPNDSFLLPHRNIHKKVKKWMIEEKIPVELREFFPLLCADEKVLWAYGVGFADEVKVQESTKQLIQITLPSIGGI